MTVKKQALLTLVMVLLLAIGVYLGIQFITGLMWSAQPKPLPAITIEAMYPGADASVIAETVAAPIEHQVTGVEQMVSMRSRYGSDGSYALTVTFQQGADLAMAKVLVQNRIQLALPLLPDAVQRNGITVKEKSRGFFLVVNLSSPEGRFDSVFLSNYATIYLKDELSRVSGVSDILVVGQSNQRMRIDLDLNQLATHELTVNDVVNSVQQQHIWVAGGLFGKIGVPPPRILDVDKAGDIILKADPGARITYLKDVARLERAGVARNEARYNAQSVASLFVYPLAHARLRELRSAIEERLTLLRARLPDGLSLDVALDFTTNLERTPSFDHLWLDFTLPVGTARERTIEVLQRSEKILRTMEPDWDVLELSGPPFAPLGEHGCILIRLARTPRPGNANNEEIIQAIRSRLAKEIPEAKIRLRDLSGTGRLPPGNYPVRFAVHGPDQDKVRSFATKLVDQLTQSAKLTDVCVNHESVLSPQLFVDIDSKKTAELGVSLHEITKTLKVCLDSRLDGFDYVDLRFFTGIRAKDDLATRVADLKQVKVRNDAGKLVSLEALVKPREVQSARVVNRFDMLPMEEITANPAQGVSLAEARSLCASLAEVVRQELRLTPDFRLTWQ